MGNRGGLEDLTGQLPGCHPASRRCFP
jgi:hypothetical protein